MKLIRRLRYLIRNRQNERELAQEIEFHRQIIEERQRHGGASEQDAAMAAKRQMGSATLAREDARGVWLANWVQSAFQDLRYAARSLKRQPSFTAFALLAIALGTGVNASLFTVYNAVALRTWPVRDPERVVRVSSNGILGFSMPEYRYLSAYSHATEGLALESGAAVTLDDAVDGPPRSVHFITGNYFTLLGVKMALGRPVTAADDRWEAPEAVAVLSYRIWRTRYGADPAILGRQVRLNSAPFTVIGVAQEDFTGTSAQYDLWAPLASKPAVNPEARTELMGAQWCCYMVARLAPGATREQARAELLGLYRQFRTGIGREPNDITLRGSRYLDRGGDKMGFYLVFAVLAAACGAVLLVACANVANLLLARGAARRHEFAVRVSIGAGRARIVRQLLTESLLLAVLGSGLGLPLAYLLPGLFAGQSTAVNWGPDIGVLGAMIALAIVSALLFGLAPAVRATGAGIHESMKQGARSSSARFPLRSLLLGGQAAISVTLLVGAALLIRGLSAARSLDYGFKIGGIATITVQLPATAYDPARLRAFYDDVVQEMKPYGAVGVGSSPLDAPRLPIALTDEKTSEIRLAKHIAANAGYLDVLGIAIAAGRNLNPADRQNRRILVNEAMARSYWPSQIPVGKAIFNGGERYEIVGVVRDSRLSGPGAGVEPAYFSHSDAGLLFVPSSLAGAAARVVNHLDPRARLTLAPLSDSLDRLLAPASRAALFAEMLGVLALLLATVGVYGVMSYSVEQRRREIGIRMALGAHPREILKLALLRHTRPLVCGLAVGLAASVAASQVLVSLLYGLTPVDPLAYGAALIVMLAAGAVASAVPAFRACRIDPVETLRYD